MLFRTHKGFSRWISSFRVYAGRSLAQLDRCRFPEQAVTEICAVDFGSVEYCADQVRICEVCNRRQYLGRNYATKSLLRF